MTGKIEKQHLAEKLREVISTNKEAPIIIQWDDGFSAKVIFASSYEPSDADDRDEVESFTFYIQEILYPSPPPSLGNFQAITISIKALPKEIRTSSGVVLWEKPFDEPRDGRAVDNLVFFSKWYKDKPSRSEALARMERIIDFFRFAQFWKNSASREAQISETKVRFLKMKKSILEFKFQPELAKKEISSFKEFVSKLAEDNKNMDPGFRSLVVLCDMLEKAS